jgi:hypothetical protein
MYIHVPRIAFARGFNDLGPRENRGVGLAESSVSIIGLLRSAIAASIGKCDDLDAVASAGWGFYQILPC